MKYFNKKKLFFFYKLGLLSFVGILLFNFFYSVISIYSGELKFYPQIGWVDWNHALPNGTIKLIDDYNNIKKNSTSSFNINYEQRQKKSFFQMKARINFQVESCSNNDTVNLYYIFTEVSNFFEERQSKVPILHSRLRSLGDSTGNNISFYCAITHTNIMTFKNSIEPEVNIKSVWRLFKHLFFLNYFEKAKTPIFSTNNNIVNFSSFIIFVNNNMKNCEVKILNKSAKTFLFNKKLAEQN